MKTKKGFKTSKMTIISIVVLDIILMILFLFFSGQILNDFQQSSNLSSIVISSFAVVIPGTLLILIIIQFYKLIKNRFSPGNHFKRNIVTYFIAAIILVVIPQLIISVSFINVSTNNWLNKKVTDAVDIGLDMALDMENQTKSTIASLSKNRYFSSILRDIYNNPKFKFEDINQINPAISSIQILTPSGVSISKTGTDNLFIENIDSEKNNFFYPKIKLNNREVQFYQYITELDKEKIIVIIGHIFPENFSKNGILLTSVKRSLSLAAPQKNNLKLGMFVFYLMFSIPIILLSILSTFIFSDKAVMPLQDIEDAIKKVADGNYSYRILYKKNNEFNILINSFNNMIKEIEKSRNKLKHTEQISTWQEIATRLAHEIKNPLTPIKLSAQKVLMKENLNSQTSINIKYMETIINEVTRMEKLLNEFRDFARFPKLEIKNISLKNTIAEAVKIYSSSYPTINFCFEAVQDIYADADKNQMIQVVSNLTINGIHAIKGMGEITYTCETVIKKNIEHCRISIKDNGSGMNEELKSKIFKPYFTTKYNGSGLGLAIVNKIVLDHKGKIWLESAENIGTTFYIEIPKEFI